MFKQLSPSILEHMLEHGSPSIRFKEGWENAALMQTSWTSIPCIISYRYMKISEDMFTGYISNDGDTVQVSNLEVVNETEKSIVDSYMYLTLCAIIEFARNNDKSRVIVDSHHPSIVDHMVDLGFQQITAKGMSIPGGRGCLILKEKRRGKASI